MTPTPDARPPVPPEAGPIAVELLEQLTVYERELLLTKMVHRVKDGAARVRFSALGDAITGRGSERLRSISGLAPDDSMSIEDAVERTGGVRSSQTLRRWAARGWLDRAYRESNGRGAWRVPLSEVQRMIREGTP